MIQTVSEQTSRIWEHTSDCLILSSLQDFSQEAIDKLEARYSGLADTQAKLQSSPNWEQGSICPVQFGKDTVIFLCCGEEPTYKGLRESLLKLVKNKSQLPIKIKSAACGGLGHPVLIEAGVIAVTKYALNKANIVVDLYQETR